MRSERGEEGKRGNALSKNMYSPGSRARVFYSSTRHDISAIDAVTELPIVSVTTTIVALTSCRCLLKSSDFLFALIEQKSVTVV